MTRQYTRAMDRFLTHEVQMTSKATEDEKTEERMWNTLSSVPGDHKSISSDSGESVRRGVARSRSNTTMYDGNEEIDRDVPLSADWRTVYRAMACELDEADDSVSEGKV